MPSSSLKQHDMDQSMVNGRPKSGTLRVQPAIPFALTRPASSKSRAGTEVGRVRGSGDGDVLALSVDQQVSSAAQQTNKTKEEDQEAGDGEAASQRQTSILSLATRSAATSTDAVPFAQPDLKASSSSAEPNHTEVNDVKLRTDTSAPVVAPSPQAPASASEQHGHVNGTVSPPPQSNVQFRARHHLHRSRHSNIVFGGADSPASASSPSSATFSTSTPPHSASGRASAGVPGHRNGHPGYTHERQPSAGQTHVPFAPPPNAPHNVSFTKYAAHPSRHSEPLQQLGGDIVRSPNHSHTSSATFYPGDDLRRAPEAAYLPGRQENRINGNPSLARPSYQAPVNAFPPMDTMRLQNADALRDHVLSHLSESSFADCLLFVVDGNSGEQAEFPCHSLILSRSRSLLSIIRPADVEIASRWKFSARLQLDRKIDRLAIFTDALRYLYGGSLPELSHPPFLLPGAEDPINNNLRMKFALQYVAMGHQLQLTALGIRGVDLAASLLHWDTIVPALAFALQGGLSGLWTVDDGSEDRSSCSSDDSRLRAEANPPMPTYDPFATDLLQRIVTFMAQMVPHNFYLDASAPYVTELGFSTSAPPNAVAHDAMHRPHTDPRLSRIRFGEAPVDEVQRPSFIMTTISSVLLTLPFPVLKCILEHVDLAFRLGPDTVSSIMRQVIHEREARRIRVIAERQTSQTSDHIHGPSAPDLSWVESAEPSQRHRAGFRLTRRRRGIDTPASSDVPSEPSK